MHLAGALIEHFLEGIDPIRHWYIIPNEKTKKIFSSEFYLYQSFNGARSTSIFKENFH